MKLHVETKETNYEIKGSGGLFRSPRMRHAWIVWLKVELTEEELAIATKYQLWTKEFFSYGGSHKDFDFDDYDDASEAAAALVAATAFTLDLHSVANGVTTDKSGKTLFPGKEFDTINEAKDFERLFVEKGMPKLKQMLESAAQPEIGTKTYDF